MLCISNRIECNLKWEKEISVHTFIHSFIHTPIIPQIIKGNTHTHKSFAQIFISSSSLNRHPQYSVPFASSMVYGDKLAMVELLPAMENTNKLNREKHIQQIGMQFGLNRLHREIELQIRGFSIGIYSNLSYQRKFRVVPNPNPQKSYNRN